MSDPLVQQLPLEFRLMLACLNVSSPERRRPEIEHLVDQHPDWNTFIRESKRHKVEPQIFGLLNVVEKKAFPEDVRNVLKARFLRNTKRSMDRIAELVRLIKLFAQDGIPVISLKGSPLALWTYGDVSLRYAGDVDLLVSSEHFKCADRIIQNAGYRNVTSGMRYIDRLQQLMPDAQYDSDVSRIHIELHWRLTPRKLLTDPFVDLYGRSETITIGGFPVPVLAPEDRLLHLLVHGSDHAWFRIRWLCDIAYIIHRHDTLDWSRIKARAGALGLDRVLEQAMYLAQMLLGASVPGPISLRDTPDRHMKNLISTAIRAMLEPDPFMMEWHTLPLRQVLEGMWYRTKLHRSVRYKAGVLRDMLVRPQDWDDIPLPRFLFPLYYILGPSLFVGRCLAWSRDEKTTT